METSIRKSNGWKYALEVSNYDRTASLFLSLIIMLGLAVFVLLVFWLIGKTFPTSYSRTPVERVKLRDPAVVEPSQIIVPPLGEETDLQTTSIGATLAEVEKVVVTTISEEIEPIIDEWPKPPLPETEPRWEFRLPQGLTLNAYAEILSSFDIELGVILPGGKVHYAYHLAKSKPDTRTGEAEAEQRYYLTWQGGDLQEADRQLLRRAGINPRGRLILKFLPAELETELGRLAQQKKEIDRRPGDHVLRTRFGMRKAGSQAFEFFVIEQSYRPDILDTIED